MSDLPAVSYLFDVAFETLPIGRFTRLEGLSARYNPLEVKEGGENSIVHHLPGRLTYGNVSLTRAVDNSSGLLAAWFTSLMSAIGSIIPAALSIMTIEAINPDGEVVATWVLQGVTPVSYRGPTYDPMSGQVAFETIEVAHTGFLSFGGASI